MEEGSSRYWDYSIPVSRVFFEIAGGRTTLTEIVKSLDEKVTHPALLERLHKLEKEKVVTGKKEGRSRFYSVVWEKVAEEFITHIFEVDEDLLKSDVRGRTKEDQKEGLEMLKRLSKAHKNPLIVGLIKAYIESYGEFNKGRNFVECATDFPGKMKLMGDKLLGMTKGKENAAEKKELVLFIRYLVQHSARYDYYPEFDSVMDYVSRTFKGKSHKSGISGF